MVLVMIKASGSLWLFLFWPHPKLGLAWYNDHTLLVITGPCKTVTRGCPVWLYRLLTAQGHSGKEIQLVLFPSKA